MPNWTDKQREAITRTGSSLLVSAAAGSGKTAVLVARIIRMVVEDEMDVSRLLVVTFTKAAAAEMRARLQRALEEAAAHAQDEARAARLASQLDNLSQADISTMHTFCTRLLRRYFHLAGVQADFRVADEQQMAALRGDVLEALLQEQYAQMRPPFEHLTRIYANAWGDAPLRDALLRIVDFARCQEDPEAYLARCTDMYAQPEQDAWRGQLLREAQMRLAGAQSDLARAMRLARRPEGPAYYAQIIAADQVQAARLAACAKEGWEPLLAALSGVTFARMTAPRKEDTARESYKTRVKELRTRAKDAVQELAETLVPLSGTEAQQDQTRACEVVSELCRLAAAYMHALDAAMVEVGVLDFSGLEQYALRALDAGASEECRARYEAIFFDEYQDANAVQEAIIRRVARADNLFLVGDVKQCIYRFRLADPSLFLQKYHAWGKGDVPQAARIDLAHNFRSKAGVLRAANSVFGRIMRKRVCGLDYDADARLRAGREDASAGEDAVEIHLLKSDRDTAWDDELAAMVRDEREARLVALRVKDLLAKGAVWDDAIKARRPVQKRDIVILLRSPAATAQMLVQALATENIEAYADVAMRHFDAVEVQALIALLRVIDNPYQDIPLLACLRSPLFGYSVQELCRVRLAARKGPFIEAVRASAAKQDALGRKCSRALEMIDRFRLRARATHIAGLLQAILDETGYLDIMAAWPLAQLRRANVRLLLRRARDFQAQTHNELADFLRMVDEARAGEDMQEAHVLASEQDVVRIMSIHKSKGLEFPIVLLPMLSRRFNRRQDAAVWLDKQLGMGVWSYDVQARTRRDNLARMAIARAGVMEGTAEEMRILYVAMTRAREQLILTATTPCEPYRAWCAPMDDARVADARCLMDWIGPCALRDMLDARLARKTRPARWRITLHDAASIRFTGAQEDGREVTPGAAVGAADAYDVFDALSWRYAHLEDTRTRSKHSVTELARAYALPEELRAEDAPTEALPLASRPDWQQQADQGARLGTLLHVACRHLDFTDAQSQAKVEAQLAQMIRRGLLAPQDAASVRVPQLLALACSPLGQQLADAQRVGVLRRETPFTLAVPAQELPGGAGAGRVIVQGAIDAWFPQGEGLVVVDFKSDRVWDAGEALIARYAPQLDWYARALEALTGRRVRARYLYTFALGRALLVE
nr:helicase-exonuclease AddAB subunit AddA [Maliibacterium massiliense]